LATASTLAWKSTGKPPGVYYHWHNLLAGSPGGYISGLPYADPCGAIGGIGRICNMAGNVLTPGNHDLAGEPPGGQFHANNQDRLGWVMSPTINLMSTGNGPGFYNDTGIDQEIGNTTAEIQIFGDMYVNLLQFGFTGNGSRGGFQTYPGIQAGNLVRTWATPVKTIGFNAFDGNFGCYRVPGYFTPLAGTDGLGEGTYLTTNANGVADSVRIFYENTHGPERRVLPRQHLAGLHRRRRPSGNLQPGVGPVERRVPDEQRQQLRRFAGVRHAGCERACGLELEPEHGQPGT
jgi:hypothetical protein